MEESLTDEQKLEQIRSPSTAPENNEIENTLKIERQDSATEIDRIHLTRIDTCESNDDDLEEYPITRRDRTRTITSNPDSITAELPKNDRHEARISWTNIPDQNIEYERDELVLYVQRNSRMMFAGVIDQSLFTDEYLKKLVKYFYFN
jgi:hypothetical protein